MTIFCLPWHKNCWTEEKQQAEFSSISCFLGLSPSFLQGVPLPALFSRPAAPPLLQQWPQQTLRECRTDHSKPCSAHQLIGPRSREEQLICLCHSLHNVHFSPKSRCEEDGVSFKWVTQNCCSSTLSHHMFIQLQEASWLNGQTTTFQKKIKIKSH